MTSLIVFSCSFEWLNLHAACWFIYFLMVSENMFHHFASTHLKTQQSIYLTVPFYGKKVTAVQCCTRELKENVCRLLKQVVKICDGQTYKQTDDGEVIPLPTQVAEKVRYQ